MRTQQIDHIISAMLESHDGISDMLVTVDRPFQVMSFGELKKVTMDPPIKKLTPFQTEIFALNLINGDRRLTEDLVSKGSCDSSYQLAGKARFRINIFSQKRCYSIVMRQLATRVPTIEELNLPPAFSKMTQEKNGIILVTGATGTGKTTSLAAFLDRINDEKPIHIITLEDPVEYVHSQKKATFNQRELGMDFDSFASGLRASLRQAPNVILVGEMRDRESVEIALSAAETGHLVVSTLHTVDAGQTINRIVGMFEQEEEKLIRIRLADTLKWVVCQRLLPKIGAGRIAAFEIMCKNLRVKDAILHGESEGKTFYEIIEAGRPFLMMTFDQCLADLYEQGSITEETALSYSSSRAAIVKAIDTIKASKGEKTSTIEGLAIDRDYEKKISKKKPSF